MITLVFGTNLNDPTYIPEVFSYKVFKLCYMGFWALVLFFVNLKSGFKWKLSARKIPIYLLIAIILAFANFLYFRSEIRFPMNLLVSFGTLALFTLASGIILAAHYYRERKGVVIKTILLRIFSIVVLWLALGVITFFIQLLANSVLAGFSMYAFNDLLPFEPTLKETILIATQMGIYFTVMMSMLPFYFYATQYHVLSLMEKYEAVNLKDEISKLKFKES